MVMKERDEELALFLEMRRREKENERNNLLLLQNSDELEVSNLESNRGGSPISKALISGPPRKTVAEEFLNSENDKSDYDWLLTPPDTPLFPSLEKELQRPVKSEMEIPARPVALKPRPSNIQAEPASKNNVAFKLGFGSSTTANKRPSSSGVATTATSRSATPSGRPTLPSTTKSSRSSTPTARATLSSAKQTAPPVRSSTPTTRASAWTSTPTTRRSSTPSSAAGASAAKETRRSSTPTLRSSTPSRAALGLSGPPTRASSASKARPTLAKNPVPSRGSSPSVKSRPWEPPQMPGFSHDAPPNLRTSLSERPASASRSRPGAVSFRSSSLEVGSDGKPKRQSGTPSKTRASTGVSLSNQNSLQVLSRTRFTDGDHDSPVVIGTKMVERVVNMRKLAPPRHEDHHSTLNNSSGKSSSSVGSGFGTTLSKKSLDMAMRHMDIRRSVQGGLRPLVTSIPASSMYSVRSGGSSKSRTVSASDSPLATSSSASEPSVNDNSIGFNGSETEENDIEIERGNPSPTSQQSNRIIT